MWHNNNWKHNIKHNIGLPQTAKLNDPEVEKFRFFEFAVKVVTAEINLLYKNEEFYSNASNIASVE